MRGAIIKSEVRFALVVSIPSFIDTGWLYDRQVWPARFGLGPGRTWAEFVKAVKTTIGRVADATPELVAFVFQGRQMAAMAGATQETSL